MKWKKLIDNWEVDLQGKHLRDVETKNPIPYRGVERSESFGNKWVRCWCGTFDIVSTPAEKIEWLDETDSQSNAEQEALDYVRATPGCHNFTIDEDGGSYDTGAMRIYNAFMAGTLNKNNYEKESTKKS